MKIRRALLKDLKVVVAMANDGEEPYFRRLIKEQIVLVAEEVGIMGICYGERNKEEKWADLRGLFVNPQWRNLGTGTALIKEFLKRVKGLEVEVVCEGEARLLRKLGFKKCKHFHLYIKS